MIGAGCDQPNWGSGGPRGGCRFCACGVAGQAGERAAPRRRIETHGRSPAGAGHGAAGRHRNFDAAHADPHERADLQQFETDGAARVQNEFGSTRRGLAGVALATTYYIPLMRTLDAGCRRLPRERFRCVPSTLFDRWGVRVSRPA